jgi:peptidoglycan/LPS O-acetylase OafA/YrhL
MDAIALGCLTALLIHRFQVSPKLLLALGAPLMLFTLCYYRPIGPGMTILAIGTCLIIAASAQTQWTAPRILAPLLKLGERSYEVYLTHMFIVFAFFQLFLNTGKQLKYVPILFLTTIIASALVGELVARLYSEPLNHILRSRTGPRPFPSVALK